MKKFSHYDTLTMPLYSEKSSRALENNQFVFKVLRNATKLEIKTSVEKLFNVEVVAVNTLLRKGKLKRFKGHVAQRSDKKIAYVTVKKGQSIDLSYGA